ncbi:VIT family protein [Nocardia sp. NPDC058666]|uniref:VIT1/CCC1 transporter family protein n=1 Tax=unclassified Nocardia TaxID=2637762 RepID=UPI0036539480
MPDSSAGNGGSSGTEESGHPHEPHSGNLGSRLNWLRAGVLGANDGIVSTAGLVVGVAASTNNSHTILTAGLSGLVAGALSMAAGEYISVSTQRDSEKALLAKERRELADEPDFELAELAGIYEKKGLSPATARTVAAELTAHDAFTAHAEAELGIDPHDLTNPWAAALSSAISYTCGALLPLLAIMLPPTHWKVPVTFAAVLFALAVTGTISARLGGSSVQRAVLRVMIGGALAMAVTYGIGMFTDSMSGS